jgi:hypothetical protein
LDAALDAGGVLLDLVPAVIAERLLAAEARAAGRRYDEHDVDPCNRRDLLDVAAGVALSATALSHAPAPGAAREVDPALADHWMALMQVLEQHDGVFGAGAVIDIVRHQQRQIAQHREVARNGVRRTLLRVEARWSNFASWLYGDIGDRKARDAATRRTLALAREADYSDVIAYALQKQARWAIVDGNARRAVALADRALDVHDATPQTLAQSALAAAQALAFAGNGPASAERLQEVEKFLDAGDDGRDRLGPVVTMDGAPHYVAGDMARCRLLLEPAAAVTPYEDVLRDWPREHVRDGGLEQARLAFACAAAGENDRAKAEGRKALAIARQTRSATAARELRQLGAVMREV